MMKSPAYPLLDGLVDLACRDGVDIRPTLLRVLTDLYIQKPTHSADEEAQYVELAMGLIEAVDAPTRDAVIARLSNYPGAPAAVLRKLNADPPPSPAASARREAEAETLIESFFTAGAAERRLILGNLDTAANAPTRRPALTSSEVIRRLETAAMQHNTGEFSRTLARALGIGQTLAERVARDRSGEPIVVATKAIGMTPEVLQRVLLFLNPAIGQSVEQVHDLSRFFEELRPAAAQRMVAIWRMTGVAAEPQYEAAHYDDEGRGARSVSSSTQHRVARDREERLARVKTGQRR